MKKRLKSLIFALLLIIPLVGCSEYKKVSNTKKLNNYEYTLKKKININDTEEEYIEEKGYVNKGIEKRITTINDKNITTYIEKGKLGTFIYKEDKNGEYVRNRIPDNMSSYLNLIDSNWVKYENGNIVLDNNSSTKILRMLHIHKYLADDVELRTFDYTDNGKYITSLNVTLDLLKNEEIIGNASIEFNIENIDTVKEIELPKVKMRAN